MAAGFITTVSSRVPDTGHGRGGGEIVPPVAPQPADGLGIHGPLNLPWSAEWVPQSDLPLALQERRTAGWVGRKEYKELSVAKKITF